MSLLLVSSGRERNILFASAICIPTGFVTMFITLFFSVCNGFLTFVFLSVMENKKDTKKLKY